MLDQTGTKLNALVASDGGGREVQEVGFVGFLEVHASEQYMRKLRARIERLVAGLEGKSREPRAGRSAHPDRRYRLSIAFFPLDLPKR